MYPNTRHLAVASLLLLSIGCADQGTNSPRTTAEFPGVGSSYRHRIAIIDSATGNRSDRVDTTRVTEVGLSRGGREGVVHLDKGHLFGYYLFQPNGDVGKLVYLYDPITFRAIDSGWQMMPFGSRDTTRLDLEQSSSGKTFRHSVECSFLGTESRTVGSETFTTHNARIVRTASIASVGGGIEFVVRSIDTVSYAPEIFGIVRWAVVEQATSSSDTTGRYDLSELEAYQVR